MARVVQLARYQADGTQVTREFDKMGAAGEKMGKRVRDGANSMSPALKGVDAAAGAARQKVDGLAGSAGTLGRVLTAMGPAGLAAAAAIGGLVVGFTALQAATRNAVREIGAIATSAQRVGVSTDALQELRFAIIGIGGAAEQADQAYTQFAEKLGEATLTRSGGGFNALKAIGFTDQEIANMRSVEETLPRIAERIGGMASATEQMRVAKELGLEPLLPLLQQGADAFDEAARAAHEMGYVLDRDLIARAHEMNGQWEQASRIIDLQFKSALVDLAPHFVDLARNIAEATTALVAFLDAGKALERQAQSTIRDRVADAGAEQLRLIARYGNQVTSGGNANLDPLSAGVLNAQPWSGLQSARDRYAALEAQVARDLAELRRRELNAPGATSPTTNTVTPNPALDAARAQLQQFVDQLNEEAATRARVNELSSGALKLTREEAAAIVQTEADLRRLQEARAAGVIASDAELKRLIELRTARDAEAEAIRRQEEERQRLAQIEAANAQLRAQVETPRERIAREMAALKDPSLDPELVARRMRQLQEEYRELAAAQHEASFAGQALAAAIDGQVRSFGDLGNMLRDLVADSVIRELLAGGVSGEGGIGGFLGRVGDRVAGGITGDSSSTWQDLFGGFRAAADEAAELLSGVFSSSVSDAAAQAVVGSVSAAKENIARNAVTTQSASMTIAFKAATLAANEFAAAAATAAAAGDGGKGGSVAKLVTSLFKGGGRAGGGSLFSGARHPGAELGPEVAIFGGWGHVAPTEAFDGLALLGRLSRQAQAAPAAQTVAAAPTINIINQTSEPVDARAETRIGENGEQVIDVLLTRKISSDIASGRHDDALRQSFGLRRPMRSQS